MPSSKISRVFRQAYRSVRGIRTESLLPPAGLLAGVLLGVIAWWVLQSWVLDYRAEVLLAVGPADRAGDAALALAGRVEDPGFRANWDGTAKGLGLAGQRSLRAVVLDAGKGQVNLVCRGRPRLAAHRALARVRDGLADAQGSGLTLKPPRFDEKQKDLAQHIGDKAKELKDLKQRQEASKPPEGDDRKFREIEGRIPGDEKECESARKALQDAGDEKQTAGRHGELLAEQKTLAAEIGGLPAPGAEERRKLREEYERLGQVLKAEALQDSTPNHPVVRRREQIRKTLRAAELAGLLDETGKQLEALRDLKAKHDAAKARLDKDQQELDIEDKARRNRGKTYEVLRTQVSQAESEEQEAKNALEQFKKQPWTGVQATVAGPVLESIPRGWLVWPCLGGGLAAGALLALILRRHPPVHLSGISDEAALARKVHVPVLGAVPTLAGLPPRQE